MREKKKIGIVGKPDLVASQKAANDVISFLDARGYPYVVESDLATAIGMKGTLLEEMKVDVLITLGGDGTLLRAVQRQRCSDLEILGINVDSMGFLTEIRPSQIQQSLERLLSGDYRCETHMRMRTQLNDRRGYDCLNEATVHTASIAKMIHVGIWVDDHEVEDLRTDGVVVATPTGSTSYAMSAGGPLLDPRVEALLIVPIAPFKLSARPLVVPASAKIKIKLLEGKEGAVVLDGQHETTMAPGDVFQCTASDSPVKLIRLGTNFFYRRVREKLCGR